MRLDEIRKKKLKEGRAEEFAIQIEHSAISKIRDQIERTAVRLDKDEEWKEGAMWAWKKFADRWGYRGFR